MPEDSFFDSKKEYDKEMTVKVSTIILHCLAHLKQNEKINEFLTDKYIVKILPEQIGLAYNSYALLVRDDNEEVIKLYEANKKGLVKPVHPAIVFNTAEAYFRDSQYKKAIALFDDFVAEYSHLDKAPHSRLRIALSYDILESPIAKTQELYKSALNRSTNPGIRYEAKLRYISSSVIRKLEHTPKDIEKLIFFDMSPDEKKAMNNELKKLLWQSRLRSFISQKQYKKALTYLSSIPMNSLKPMRRKVFQADGAEIIFGLITDAYSEENFSKVIKLWETYRGKYDSEVASNPHVNFVVASSYLNLGLPNSFDRTVEEFKKLNSYTTRVFPIWIERNKNIKISNILKELVVIKHVKNENWKGADKVIELLDKDDRREINYYYYRGLIDYKLKRFNKAANDFEAMLVSQNDNNKLSMVELSELLKMYVESLHQSGQKARLVKTSKALLADIEKSTNINDSIKGAHERILYLYIENIFSDKEEGFGRVERLSSQFLKEHQNSDYTDRVKYIYGLSMIKNLKVEQGSEILNSLISDKEVPGYLKEMAKTELSAVKLGVDI
jgi:tetratricopeptide (TPR) repeat protein